MPLRCLIVDDSASFLDTAASVLQGDADAEDHAEAAGGRING